MLRPKTEDNFAYFYSVVTKDTKDQECAKRRSLFLTEQGYRYRIRVLDASEPSVDDFSFDSAEDAVVEALAEQVQDEDELPDA